MVHLMGYPKYWTRDVDGGEWGGFSSTRVGVKKGSLFIYFSL